MALETATYIDGLVATNPTGLDPKSQGDDHIRLLKSTIKATLPNITGAVTATQAELNILDGATLSTAELNVLDGVTASTAELNILDGVTATTAELNVLDGITSSTAELNILDGVTVTASDLNTVTARALKAGDTYTGTHDFTGATVSVATQTAGDSSNKPASTAFVAGAAFASALPNQAGNAGKFVTTNGTNASWADAVTPTGVQTLANKTLTSLNGGQLAGLRNKIVNGNFGINQRTYVSGAATTAGQYTLDRWKVTGTGGVTFSTTANKTTVTIPSGQTLQQVIEGLNLESGTYVLSWEGTAQGRIAGGSYGASGAVTASITGGTGTTIEFNTGTVALVMLEKGTVATPFEHRPYGMELALCQRYYYRFFPATGDFAAGGFAGSTTTAYLTNNFPVPMRVAPSAMETTGAATDYRIFYKTSAVTCSVAPTYSSLTSNVIAQSIWEVASGLTAGEGCSGVMLTANGYLGWSAEL